MNNLRQFRFISWQSFNSPHSVTLDLHWPLQIFTQVLLFRSVKQIKLFFLGTKLHKKFRSRPSNYLRWNNKRKKSNLKSLHWMTLN